MKLAEKVYRIELDKEEDKEKALEHGVGTVGGIMAPCEGQLSDYGAGMGKTHDKEQRKKPSRNKSELDLMVTTTTQHSQGYECNEKQGIVVYNTVFKPVLTCMDVKVRT
ncbi:hypothetical protein MML48_4g00007775 [Holotrichia oblita]|uniref:Uncharacterized protein n=1 Tax=Holotrichia oblita TaxID=644536 RepID=A0ACB9TB79_HOLOL|nr:hypothetical protein MML48_4g00007775 [Holotrichia oblita]